MTDRLRLWLLAHDIAEKLRAPRRVQYWLLMRAADAVHYEPIEIDHRREPF